LATEHVKAATSEAYKIYFFFFGGETPQLTS